jgi:hypothetical protein
MTGPILLVIGVVALFAAIVGGGIKFKDIEVGSVKSLWRQGLLGIFGIIVSLVGLVLIIDPDIFSNSEDDTTQNSASSDQTGGSSDQGAATTASEAAPTDSNAADQNTVDAGTQTATDNNSGGDSTQ